MSPMLNYNLKYLRSYGLYREKYNFGLFSHGSKNWKQSLSISASSLHQTRVFSSTLSNKQKPQEDIVTATKTLMHLSKFNLCSLVVFTTSVGYFAAGVPVDYVTLSSTCLGTMLAAASASTFNHILEADRDIRMVRTLNRPIPSKRITPKVATAWGVFCGTSSFLMLHTFTNPLTTVLGMGNVFLYAIPYTLSKPRTEFNTWIGSLVGAIPPLMGWTAATGSLLALDPAFLGGTLFLWQFPHFFALAWMYRQDYARGGFKMVPCNDPSGERTSRLILKYSLYLTSLPILASALDLTSWAFAIEGNVANGFLVYRALKFNKDRSIENAKQIFKTSLWHLPLMLVLLGFHSNQWKQNVSDTADNAGSFDSLEVPDWLKEKMSDVKILKTGLCLFEKYFGRRGKTTACATEPVEVADEACIMNSPRSDNI